MKVQLGSEATDQISGFKGIVTGICEYLTGCRQALLQPRVKEGGDPVDSRWFDEDRLFISSTPPLKLKINNAGPDREAPRK